MTPRLAFVNLQFEVVWVADQFHFQDHYHFDYQLLSTPISDTNASAHPIVLQASLPGGIWSKARHRIKKICEKSKKNIYWRK